MNMHALSLMDVVACGQAEFIEVAAPQRSALGAGKDERARLVFDEDRQMLSRHDLRGFRW